METWREFIKIYEVGLVPVSAFVAPACRQTGRTLVPQDHFSAGTERGFLPASVSPVEVSDTTKFNSNSKADNEKIP